MLAGDQERWPSLGPGLELACARVLGTVAVPRIGVRIEDVGSVSLSWRVKYPLVSAVMSESQSNLWLIDATRLGSFIT